MSINWICSSFRTLVVTFPRNSLLLKTEVQNIVGSPRSIWTTPCLMAEPMKKKKKMDPAIVKARDERRKKKIEKQIRRLEKHSKQFKPIDENEIPIELVEEKSLRIRPTVALSPSEIENRTLLEKEWCNARREEHVLDVQILDKIVYSQQRALDELRKESEELYQAAVQLDPTLVKFSFKGPVSTPVLKNYASPDGDYIDKSKKWD